MQALMYEATVQYAIAQIETDSTMTGEDKQISHCWESLCKANIIMSLVSVRENKETNGSVQRLCCLMSVIYVVIRVLFKDFLAADLRVLSHGGASARYHVDKTDRPCIDGQGKMPVSQLIKKRTTQSTHADIYSLLLLVETSEEGQEGRT